MNVAGLLATGFSLGVIATAAYNYYIECRNWRVKDAELRALKEKHEETLSEYYALKFNVNNNESKK